MRALAGLPLVLVLAGCVSQPDIYAPPAQRKPLNENLSRYEPVLEMSDPTNEPLFMEDIAKGPQSASWRWTGKRPIVKLAVHSTSNYRFRVDFAIADVTFKKTGPLTITFLVNDYPLDKVTYATPGEKTFDKPIPMHLLKPMDVNYLGFEVDKTYLESPAGRPLGVILVRLGLVQ
jgi:hypothetical protein